MNLLSFIIGMALVYGLALILSRVDFKRDCEDFINLFKAKGVENEEI